MPQTKPIAQWATIMIPEGMHLAIRPELLSQLTEVNFVKIVDGELLLQPTASSLLNIVVSYFPSEAPTNESV